VADRGYLDLTGSGCGHSDLVTGPVHDSENCGFDRIGHSGQVGHYGFVIRCYYGSGFGFGFVWPVDPTIWPGCSEHSGQESVTAALVCYCQPIVADWLFVLT